MDFGLSAVQEHKRTPIRILVVAYSLRGRGTERTVVRLLRTFNRNILSPCVLLFEKKGEFLDQVPGDIHLDVLFDDDKTYRPRYFLAAVLQFLRYYHRHMPDVVLSVHTTPGRVVAAAKRFMPTIRHIAYETDPMSRIEKEKGLFTLRLLITRWLYSTVDRFIAASNVVARDLCRLLSIPESKVTVIPNPCVDDEMFLQCKEPVSERPFSDRQSGRVIINVGNMYAHKSQDVLIRAFSEVVRSGWEVYLVLIGEGPERPNLEALVRSLGLENRVFFYGFVKNPFKYVAKADVYVSPSASEGFDISQVEAMALGIPVIVTDGDRYMAVKNNETGLVVPVGNAKAMAEAIVRVLNNKKLAETLATNARKEALKLSSENIAREYESVILDVIK